MKQCRFGNCWFVFIPAGLLFLGNTAAHAGSMIEVAAPSSTIRVDKQLVANVRRGEKLWVFRKQDGWLWVKHPAHARKGWIPENDVQNVKLSTANRGLIQEAARLRDQANAITTPLYSKQREQTWQQIWQRDQRAYGDDHPDTAAAKANYAGELDEKGESAQAADLIKSTHNPEISVLRLTHADGKPKCHKGP